MAQSSPFTYGLSDIIRRLGQDAHPNGRDTSPQWRRAHLSRLIRAANFPSPLPLAVPLAATGEAGQDHLGPYLVTSRSRWIREAVDQWFYGQTPTDALDAIDAAAAREAAQDMDHRALNLKLIQGGKP